MATLAMKFKQEKLTKNSVRFQEVDEDDQPVERDATKIGSLYVQKSAFEGAVPEYVTVQLTY